MAAWQMRLVRRTRQEAATWGVTKMGLKRCCCKCRFSLSFRGDATHRQLLRTAAFSSTFVALCATPPFRYAPFCGMAKEMQGASMLIMELAHGTLEDHPQISGRCIAYGRLGYRKHPCIAKCWVASFTATSSPKISCGAKITTARLRVWLKASVDGPC